jgi:hypothetical protein
MTLSPAMIRTATWCVLAWNQPAAVVLTDYAKLPHTERNILRRIFLDPQVREVQADWEGLAVAGRRFSRGCHPLRRNSRSETAHR